MSVITNNLLLGEDGYNISRSVRLRSSASAYFNRTPASAGNRKTWTWSGWVKRGLLSGSTNYALMGAGGSAPNYGSIRFSSDALQWFSAAGGSGNITTTQIFRDASAWYHIVIAADTTQATASNRIKVYVNGVQVTTFNTATYPTQNYDTEFNSTSVHAIGSTYTGTYQETFDGYLTEINFIDGQTLTPSSFGETDSITGVWKPKKYAGTYGTNGFFLNFSDNSNNTAATIGKDSSGNGNNWTPNNISVTSGVTYDSMLDVPTMWADGGNGRGNYPVLNPLFNTGTLGYLPTRNANLNVYESSGSAAWRSRWSTIGITSGKFYAEFTISYSGSTSITTNNSIAIGLHDGGSAVYIGETSTTYGYFTYAVKYNNATSTAYGATYANGDVIGVAYDADAGTLTFYKNGTSQGVAYSSIPAGTYFFAVSAFWVSPDGNTNIYANFGQRPFAYTPPTGFKALNTQNLPDATIKKGNAYFNAVTYTGNGATGQTISGAGFQPDLVWVKSRSAATDNGLQDAVRGATKDLNSNNTDAEETRASSITAFTSDGFTLGGNDAVYNSSGATYVGWQWKESVSAGFDIVTTTMNASGPTTINHNLGVTPSFVITKNRNGTVAWNVYSPVLGVNQYLQLNATIAATTLSGFWGAPTSTQFTFGSPFANTGTYVAYLFAEVAGYSKFGSYTGNGSTDGPFVYTGFRPKFVMMKRTDSAGSWFMLDTARGTYNVVNPYVIANGSNSEATDLSWDLLSNGFKLRSAYADINTSSGTFIYAAFAENPFKNSLAR